MKFFGKKNEVEYISKVEFTQFSKKIEKTLDGFITNLQPIVTEINNIKKEISNQPIINLDPISKRIDEAEEDNKSLIKIISTLNDSLSKLDKSIKSNKADVDTQINQNNELFEKTKNDLDQISEKLDVSVDVLLEKISDQSIEEEENLPDILKENRCPFKPKKGYCAIWAKRKKKSEGLLFCHSCIEADKLLDKGIRL